MGTHGFWVLLVGLTLTLYFLRKHIFKLKQFLFFSFLRYEACSSQRVVRFNKPIAYFFRITMFLNLPIFNHEDLVTFLEIFNLVGGNNHCLAFAELLQAVLEYLFGNLCVNTGQGTVKQVYICFRVQSPCQRNPCLFALGQGHSFLPYHCEISF